MVNTEKFAEVHSRLKGDDAMKLYRVHEKTGDSYVQIFRAALREYYERHKDEYETEDSALGR
jgi:hypothetical protein